MTSDREGSLQPLDEDKVRVWLIADGCKDKQANEISKKLVKTFGASRKADYEKKVYVSNTGDQEWDSEGGIPFEQAVTFIKYLYHGKPMLIKVWVGGDGK